MHIRLRRLDLMVLVPLIILFVTSLQGLSLHEALHLSLEKFLNLNTGFTYWLQVLVLNFLVFFYIWPVTYVQKQCENSCSPDQSWVKKAMAHLNHLTPKVIGLSIVIFALGEAARFSLGGMTGLHAPGVLGPAQALASVADAGVTGLFVGVIMAMHFENRLFESRRFLLSLDPSVPLRKTSVIGRTFAVLSAMVLFMTFQAFNSMGSFFQLGLQGPEAPLRALSGPELMTMGSKFAGLADAMTLFGIKTLLFGGFIMQMLIQLKNSFRAPLDTTLTHLRHLSSHQDTGGTKAIAILQDDEYAPIFRQINSLMELQSSRLEVSERRLEGIIQNAPDPVVAFDHQGIIKVYNPAAEAVFEFPASEVLGKNISVLVDSTAGDFRRAHVDGIAQFEWTCAHNEKLHLESHLSGAQDGSDQWTTVILRDISAQKELESVLTKARNEAQDASRMKSEFLANMSHELRTPLNAVLGFTQLLGEDKNLTAAQQERLKVISHSGEHLLALINDILDISKIEAGKMEVHPQTFDLPEFVRDLQEMFSLKCRSKGLNFYVDTLDGLPQYVAGDLGKLRQVMINLLGNAVKFTTEGGISILVGRQKDRIRFAVQDTGRGIPQEELELILQPFFQASTTDHEGGTGLGLAISRRYLEMMGGSLEVESRLGEGSTFSFSLPLPQRDQAPQSRMEEAQVSVRPGEEILVLVVDDQLTNRLVLKEMLERAGFTVMEAENGAKAVELTRELNPRIVFMDIKMPVLDGYGAVSQIKAGSSTAKVKVFALTASAFSHDEDRIRQAGFDGFLAKPFKRSMLHRLILDKGGVELVEETALSPHVQVMAAEPQEADFTKAAMVLGPVGIGKLEEASAIGDYRALAELARNLSRDVPSLASSLEAAAASYDEGRLNTLLNELKKKGELNG